MSASGDTAVTKLRLDVESTQVEKATSNLNALAKAGAVALVGLAALTTVASTVSYWMQEGAKQSSKLKAEIASVRGTAEGVDAIFSDLLKIADDYDGGIVSLTASFRELKAAGLDPTQASLAAYRDTAAHFGAELPAYLGAVTKAANGQFQALKQYGIDVKRTNDELSISFQGTTTKVNATVKSLEGYLTKLGQSKFAGAQALKDNNINEIIADTVEQFDKFFIVLAHQQNLDDALGRPFAYGLEKAVAFNDYLASGALESRIREIGLAFEPLKIAAESTWVAITAIITRESSVQAGVVDAASQDMHSIWLDYPTGAKAAVDRVVEYFADMITRLRAYASAFGQMWSIEFDALKRKAASAALDVLESFQHPLDTSRVHAETEARNKQIDADRDLQKKAVDDVLGATLKSLDRQHTEAEQRITDERNERIAGIESYYQKAQQLREKYGKEKGDTPNLDKEGSADRAIPKTGGKGGAGSTKNQDHELQMLIHSLELQEQRVATSYLTRLDLIDKYTKDGSREELDMSNKLVDITANELTQINYLRDNDYAQFFSSLKNAENLLYDSYQERKRIITENTQITEEERLQLLTAAENKYTNAQRQLEHQRQTTLLKASTEFFGNIASIGSAFGKKGFEIAKAAGIAQATISTYSSAVKAYDSLASIPYIGPALGAAAAAAAIASGVANIAQIKSQTYSGAYDKGGMIPAGQYGLVGENGPEFISGPAIVTGRDTSSSYLGKGGSAPVNVQVFNLPGQTAVVQQSTGANGEQQVKLIIQKVEEKLTADARTGGGAFVPALASAFQLARKS